MPVKVSVTCDICGSGKAVEYPSFFELRGGARNYRSTSVPGVVEDMGPPLAVSTVGRLRNRLTVCLCHDHFSGLEAALADWVAGLLSQPVTP